MAHSNRIFVRTPVKPGYGYGYSLLFVLLDLILTGVFWWQLPPQIPLFYSLPYGSAQLADRRWFLLLPVFSLLTWFAYFLLSRISYRSPIYIQILKWLQITSLFLITIAIIHILLVSL